MLRYYINMSCQDDEPDAGARQLLGGKPGPKPPPKPRTGGGTSPLHLASCRGHVGVVHELLIAGADPSRGDQFGYSALHLAAKHGFPDVITELLSFSGVDVDIRDECGETPLHTAARYAKTLCLSRLLAGGASLGAVSGSGRRPADVVGQPQDKHNLQSLPHSATQLAGNGVSRRSPKFNTNMPPAQLPRDKCTEERIRRLLRAAATAAGGGEKPCWMWPEGVLVDPPDDDDGVAAAAAAALVEDDAEWLPIVGDAVDDGPFEEGAAATRGAASAGTGDAAAAAAAGNGGAATANAAATDAAAAAEERAAAEFYCAADGAADDAAGALATAANRALAALDKLASTATSLSKGGLGQGTTWADVEWSREDVVSWGGRDLQVAPPPAPAAEVAIGGSAKGADVAVFAAHASATALAGSGTTAAAGPDAAAGGAAIVRADYAAAKMPAAASGASKWPLASGGSGISSGRDEDRAPGAAAAAPANFVASAAARAAIGRVRNGARGAGRGGGTRGVDGSCAAAAASEASPSPLARLNIRRLIRRRAGEASADVLKAIDRYTFTSPSKMGLAPKTR